MEQSKNNQLPVKPKKRISVKKIVIIVFLLIILLGAGWFLFFWGDPLAEKLDLSTIPTRVVPSLPAHTAIPGESEPTNTGSLINPTATLNNVLTQQTQVLNSTRSDPICGKESDWIVLLAGLDYEQPDPGYLYGLADVVRLVHVDFTQPKVNVVSLPRALLVDIISDHFSVPGPLLLNQAYFYGARGMGHYTGTGYGAGSLAETIKYNFGISTDHYLVVNFGAFVRFIDAIGGIDIDLPTYIDDRPTGYFPPGEQHLNGEQTLYLARIREKYSDLVRINDQSMIIAAIFHRLKDPSILARIPAIYDSLKDSVITDLSPSEIENSYCLFKKMSGDDLSFFDPDWDVMIYDRTDIPTLKKSMDVFFWDQHFIDWMNSSLWAK